MILRKQICVIQWKIACDSITKDDILEMKSACKDQGCQQQNQCGGDFYFDKDAKYSNCLKILGKFF